MSNGHFPIRYDPEALDPGGTRVLASPPRAPASFLQRAFREVRECLVTLMHLARTDSALASYGLSKVVGQLWKSTGHAHHSYALVRDQLTRASLRLFGAQDRKARPVPWYAAPWAAPNHHAFAVACCERYLVVVEVLIFRKFGGIEATCANRDAAFEAALPAIIDHARRMTVESIQVLLAQLEQEYVEAGALRRGAAQQDARAELTQFAAQEAEYYRGWCVRKCPAFGEESCLCSAASHFSHLVRIAEPWFSTLETAIRIKETAASLAFAAPEPPLSRDVVLAYESVAAALASDAMKIKDATETMPGADGNGQAGNPSLNPEPTGDVPSAAGRPAPDTGSLSPDVWLSCPDLASQFRVPKKALEKRLARRRLRIGEGCREVTDLKPNEPRYLYRVGAVRSIIEEMLPGLGE